MVSDYFSLGSRTAPSTLRHAPRRVHSRPEPRWIQGAFRTPHSLPTGRQAHSVSEAHLRRFSLSLRSFELK
jgi:hypothetical protein